MDASLRLVRLVAPIAGRLDRTSSEQVRSEAATGSLTQRLYWRWLAWVIILVLLVVLTFALLFASGAPHLQGLSAVAAGSLVVVADAALMSALFGVRMRLCALRPTAAALRWFLEPRPFEVYVLLAGDAVVAILALS